MRSDKGVELLQHLRMVPMVALLPIRGVIGITVLFFRADEAPLFVASHFASHQGKGQQLVAQLSGVSLPKRAWLLPLAAGWYTDR
jgi:hypothetical protein